MHHALESLSRQTMVVGKSRGGTDRLHTCIFFDQTWGKLTKPTIALKNGNTITPRLDHSFWYVFEYPNCWTTPFLNAL